MEIKARLIKVSYVILASFSAVLIMLVAGYLLAIGVSIAFSAYTGAKVNAFMQSLEPLFHFCIGVWGGGSLTALLNALISPSRIKYKLIALGAIAGGISALVYTPISEALISLFTTILTTVINVLRG